MSHTLQAHIDKNPITPFQIFIIGLCTFLNMLDGFDILVMAFSASSVAEEFGLSNSEVGVLLSAGLFGMAIGAFLIGPYADKIGRKPVVLLSLVLISIGMIAAAYATSTNSLAIFRLITGLGVGSMIASLNTLVSEFSPEKNRSLAVTILQTGNPVGATLGGLLSVYLIAHYGWRPTFLVGGIMSVVLIPIVALYLPETIDFLSTKQPENALAKINKTFTKLKIKAVESLPAIQSGTLQTAPASNYAKLFQDGNAGRTLLLSLAFFTVMFSFYYTMSWTPKLLADSGLDKSQAISGAVIINIGGAVGSIILGVFATRFNIKNIIAVYMVSTALLMVLFGQLSSNYGAALVIAPALGFFLFGSIIGLYALAPGVYDVKLRATGIGIAIGVGRIGAVIAPLLAGYLLDSGLTPSVMFIIFSIPMLVAMMSQRSISTI